MACKTDDNGIKITKVVSGYPAILKPSNSNNIIILYATLDSVMEYIKREREATYYKEVIIYYNNYRVVPSRIVTVDTKGNEKTQYFLSTNDDPHKLDGLTFRNILILYGYFDNTKLNYIFSRLIYADNSINNIKPNQTIGPNLGNDIENTVPHFMDYPIMSSFLIVGLLLWIGYIIKGGI